VYKTDSISAAGFQPNYYVGMKIDYVAGSTTLSSFPVLVTVDLVYQGAINK
jgi:hypothetical protein